MSFSTPESVKHNIYADRLPLSTMCRFSISIEKRQQILNNP